MNVNVGLMELLEHCQSLFLGRVEGRLGLEISMDEGDCIRLLPAMYVFMVFVFFVFSGVYIPT